MRNTSQDRNGPLHAERKANVYTFSIKDPVPAPDQRVLPVEVVYKGNIVKIVEIPNRGAASFTIVYHLNGERVRITRRKFEDAFKEAQNVAGQLGDGDFGSLPLVGNERYRYERALEHLQSTGKHIDEAAAQYSTAIRLIADKAPLLDVVAVGLQHLPANLPQVSVQQVLDEFIEHKVKDVEVGPLYLRDLRNRLGAFAKSFNCPIASVSQNHVVNYIRKLGGVKRTRINHRRNIGTLFNYAKEQGYITASPVPKEIKSRKDSRINVQVYTVEEMAAFLTAAWPEVLVPLAITAFSGARAEETKRLQWEQIHLDEEYIEIPDQIAKTGVRRLLPVSANLKAWLIAHQQRTGAVVVYKNLANQYGKLAKKVGIKWKRNALRHSYVSYRVAAIKNIPQVAMEAGNSVVMVQRHYLRVVTEKAAQCWFNITPTPPGNIIAFSTPPEAPSAGTAVSKQVMS